MMRRHGIESRFAVRAFAVLLVAAAWALPGDSAAQQNPSNEVTFSRDIAPILQRSCQQCHRPGGVAPMALVEYEEVRRHAMSIMRRTGIRDRQGTMPPWYVEKDIGIQQYKDDPSLSDEEVEAIATWARNGAPEGDPADLPPRLAFDDAVGWRLGQPDLIVSTPDVVVGATDPDWWGDLPPIPIEGLDQDRYVASMEIREINDVRESGGLDRETVGGLYVFHHMLFSTVAPGQGSTTWPVHEVGRNPDIFDVDAGQLLRAGSILVPSSLHMHSNGLDTRARLEVGFRFHPVGYEPKYRQAGYVLASGSDIDIKPERDNQELHAYTVLQQHTKLVTFEPHLHAPGERMCLEAIWGFNIETLVCTGYDHNWVRGYAFADDYQPLLPAGTILHITGYMDNTSANRNIPDARNWQGSGNRSVANMFLDLGMKLALTDEQFVEAMAQRRENLDLGVNDHVIGCPLCMALPGS
jgi:mono/diheme cytochrome c family protein